MCISYGSVRSEHVSSYVPDLAGSYSCVEECLARNAKLALVSPNSCICGNETGC